ncbi:MAG: hypothetical protein PVH88_06970 [Ignavibacteria bacterium]
MIPTTNDLKSDKLTHKFGDVFNPPGITNFWGTCQADIDITGIRSFNFPPFTNSDKVTAGLFLNERYFPSLNREVHFTWFPDRIEREAEVDGLYLKSTTILPFGKTAVIIKLEITNNTAAERKVKIKFGTSSTITKNMNCGKMYHPPLEEDNKIIIEETRKAVIFEAVHSDACSVQGMFPLTGSVDGFGVERTILIEEGKTEIVYYTNVLGEKTEEVLNQFDSIVNEKIGNHFSKNELQWNDQIKAVFTEGNSEYSGFMPILDTQDKDISRLYYTGIIGTIYFRRDNPYSVYGRAYDTLMPRYWLGTTFIWDYYLSSRVHTLLDPEVMKKNIELWVKTDIHSHFGTEYLTGGTVGNWYSVNDFALTWMINDYLSWNGKFDWLNKSTGDSNKKIFDYLVEFATNYRQFKTPYGLADYGGINNLLECVSTYIHEVASLNAGNVFNLRTVSEIAAQNNMKKLSAELLEESKQLLNKLMKLYCGGKGCWNARFPGGRLVEVKHCYDFMTILNTIPADLTQVQKEEMVEFFVNELQTPIWMRALSPKDNNAMFSVRPDHQWNGAYTAWPSLAATGLYNIGKGDTAFKWLKGIAKSANQGPFAQCHFVESAMNTDSGGALKAFYEWPYGADWACSSNGNYAETIIEGLFGVKATKYDGIKCKPQFGEFDPKAELHNLRYRDEVYNVSKNGLTKIK